MHVLLTGASGFLGRHCLTALLASGHTAVGTVRDQAKADQLSETYRHAGDRVSFSTVPDISISGAFDNVLQQSPAFDAVLHTASPFTYVANDLKADIIEPAVKGTLEILEAVHRLAPSVTRVVITSSFAAVLNMREQIERYTEQTWNPITMEEAVHDGGAAYIGSKKFAEAAAWKFMNEQKRSFILSTVNPVLMFGPVIQHIPSLAKVNTSNEIVRDMIQGKMKETIPPFEMQYIDVRDVALAHVRILEHPEAVVSKRRFLATAGSYNNQEIASIISSEFPEYAGQLPGDIDIPPKHGMVIDTTGITDTLGISLRSLKDSIVETVKSLQVIQDKK